MTPNRVHRPDTIALALQIAAQLCPAFSQRLWAWAALTGTAARSNNGKPDRGAQCASVRGEAVF